MVVNRLGAGSVGVVYRAFDPHLERMVAIKLLHAGQGGEQNQRRLVREARTMARLSHPNVVQIYDSGLVEGPERQDVYLALELVEGEDLERWLSHLREPDPQVRCQRVVGVFLQAARGLAAAHEAGLVHRDFKPANVIVEHNGQAKVGDFGLARPRRQTEDTPTDPSAPAPTPDLNITSTHDVLGTPAYMAPELHQRGEASPASDQFAFCVSLWEALHGSSPFPGDEFVLRVKAVVEGRRLPAPATPGVPGRLAEVLARGLSVRPSERFASMGALADALEASIAPPRRMAVILGAAGVALALGLAFAWSPPSCPSPRPLIDEVWNAEARSHLEASFRATGLAYADRLATTLSAQIDGYAGALADGYRSACRATRVDHTQSEALLDRRMACLESERAELAAFVDGLEGADKAVLEQATWKAPTSVAACADTAALTAAVPPPSNPAEAKRVTRMRDQLAAARGFLRSGHFEQAQAAVATASAAFQQGRHIPARAELALARGRLAAARSHPLEARRELLEAFKLAQRSQHSPVAAEAATALVPVSNVDLSQPGEALVWADVAEATLLRHGPRSAELALLAGERARALSALGRRQEAMEAAKSALQASEAARADALTQARAGLQLGRTLIDIWDYKAAVPVLESALARAESALGTEHPFLVEILTPLGKAETVDRAFESASVRLARALALADRFLGPEHPSRAMVLMRIADVEGRLGHSEASIEAFATAANIMVKAYGEQHTLVARGWLNLGAAHHRAGHTREAALYYQRALGIREALLGPEHPDLTAILQNLGGLAVEEGRPRDAIPFLERALGLRTQHLASAISVGDVKYWLGRAHYDAGHQAKGVQLVVEAERIFSEHDAPALDEVRRWLEKVRRRSRRSP